MKKITLLSLVTASLWAQDPLVLDPMVVSANNFAQSIEDTTENIEVITADQIEMQHLNSVAEVLSRIANIQVTSNGGLGQAASVRLRGFDSKRVLVLIDGVRVNDVTSLNGATFEHLLVNDIARIEIINGAQSGIWGADASAGVINIITKKAKKGFHALLKAAYGSYNTTEATVGLSYKAKHFDLKLSADTVGSDGFSAAEPKFGDANYGTHGDAVGFEKDAYENRSYHAVAGINISANDRINLDAKLIEAYVAYDAAAGVDAQNVDDPFGYGSSNYFNNTKEHFYQARYTHKGTHTINLEAAESGFERDQYGGYSGSLMEYALKDLYSYSQKGKLQAGYDYQQITQKRSAGTTLDKSYNNQALFVTNYNRLENLLISEALRYDQFDVFENKMTGKLGLKYSLGDAYVSFNAGSGYNVPTLYQLYDAYSGNSALLPESTNSYDLKASHKGITIGYFYNTIKNLIDYDMGTFTYANIAGISVLQGLEFSYEKNFNQWADLRLDYTYLDARDADKKILARRANHQANVRVSSYFTQNFSTIVTAQYVGTRYDKLDSTGAQTGEYLLMNVAANYKLGSTMLFVKVDNLFDTFYQVADGYQTPGLSAKAGFSTKF